MADPVDAEIFDGSLIGERYRLGPLLGQGGQGSTYLGYDRATGQRVAVKAFVLGRAADWKHFDLFQRECQVLKSLSHPRIPRYLDEVQSDDGSTFYLVMENIRGETLRDRVRRGGALGEAELWQVLWQLVDVLSYLHGRSPPVVHRDIKPVNLIQQPNGDVVLVDFGGVRNAVRSDGGSTIVGTFGYMAPEQLHGAATPATDLYALGASLLALGTAMEPEHLPREGLRIDFAQHLQVSPKLARLLRRLTEPEPGKRPRSGAALKQELEAAMADDSGEVEPATDSVDDGLDIPRLPDDVPPPVGVAIGVLMAIVGTLGTVAVTVLDAAIVPLVFTLIAIFTKGEQQKKLPAQKQKVRLALQEANSTLRKMSGRGLREFEHNRARLPGQQHRRLRGGHRDRPRIKGR